MQEYNTESGKQAKPNNNFKKYLLLAILLLIIISLSFLIYYGNNMLLWQTTNEHENKVVTEQQGVTPVSRAANENKVHDGQGQNMESEPIVVDNQDDQIFELYKQNYLHNIGVYRRYLRIFNQLLLNFLQDKIYTDQINQIKMQAIPKDIKPIFDMLEDYNQNYLAKVDNTRQTVWFLDKIIKIEKNPPNNKEKILIKTNIIKNLDSLTEFIYSKELQDLFIKLE